MVSLGGTLSRRVRWTNSGSWSRGQIGFGGSDHMTWYSASSSLSVAIARPVALFAQYGYYMYDVPVGASSILSAPRFERQSVSVGLTTYVPVFGTGRTRR
jgi:hypothetical protein